MQGDTQAFGRLRAEHELDLRSFVRKRIPASIEADDVLQDVWIAVWNALPNFGFRSSFRTWLYQIGLNKCRDRYALYKRESDFREATTDTIPDRSDAYARLERREAVRKAILVLDDPLREVIDLYYYRELTLPEIAEFLEVNLNTVKYRFYQAHSRMAPHLEAAI